MGKHLVCCVTKQEVLGSAAASTPGRGSLPGGPDWDPEEHLEGLQQEVACQQVWEGENGRGSLNASPDLRGSRCWRRFDAQESQEWNQLICCKINEFTAFPLKFNTFVHLRHFMVLVFIISFNWCIHALQLNSYLHKHRILKRSESKRPLLFTDCNCTHFYFSFSPITEFRLERFLVKLKTTKQHLVWIESNVFI